jgi:spore maturation protein CgeB
VYEAPDFITPNNQQPMDVNEALAIASTGGFNPDAIVMICQYDFFYLVGSPTDGTPFVWLAVENFDPMQRSRYDVRKADAEFHCIAHSHPHLLPPESEWVVFGADPDLHPYLSLERTKWVCQIGSTYDPRPGVWNELRARFDFAGPLGAQNYATGLHETEHTIFGKVFNYAGMADAYNRSLCAISCSNVNFIPMRASEAFSMGCVLMSDDVLDMRKAFGDPYPENAEGIWVAYDRSTKDLGDKIEWIRDAKDEREALVQRALDTVRAKHMYSHIAHRMLEKVGLA